MKKILAVALVLLSAVSAFSAQKTTSSPKSSLHTGKSHKSPALKPLPDCEAYMVVDLTHGKVLESRNPGLRWPPASITKLMLASVVMEKVRKKELSLGAPITVSKAASHIGGTQVFLKQGETFTLEEMMRAALIESANDAAYAIAENVAGSADAFVTLMNRRAAALGMAHSEFHCVHGLPPARGDRENLTTCRDLVVLAKDLLRYPKILEWTSTRHATFRNGTFDLHNKNKLLGRVAGVDGLKTGYYYKAHFNILATGRDKDKRIVVVVLGSPQSKIRDRFAASKFAEYLIN